MKRFIAMVLFALAFVRPGLATTTPVWAFDTIPADGALAGFVGDTAGWGYAITNDHLTLWLQLDGVSSPGSTLAMISDLFDFPTLAPSTSVLLPYDGLGAGLAEALLTSPGIESDPLFKIQHRRPRNSPPWCSRRSQSARSSYSKARPR